MTVPYHFIVAGLPDLFLDEGKLDLDLRTYILDLQDQIPFSDSSLLSYIAYQIDNKNLINKLEEKNDPVLQTGNFTEEELEEEIKNPDRMPEYMQEFLAAHSNKENIIQGMSWENQLSWLFYDHVTSLENRYLSDWFVFELNLRNILAAMKCRRSSKPFEPHIICRNEITDLIFKSNAIDFGLPAKLPWADDLFTLDFYNIAGSEKSLDELRLQQLDEMAESELFSIETLLRVGLTLSIVERWFLLDDTSGRERLEQMIHELETSYNAD